MVSSKSGGYQSVEHPHHRLHYDCLSINLLVVISLDSANFLLHQQWPFVDAVFLMLTWVDKRNLLLAASLHGFHGR